MTPISLVLACGGPTGDGLVLLGGAALVAFGLAVAALVGTVWLLAKGFERLMPARR